MDYTAIFIILIAGLINGSFVVPAKFTNKISLESSWFYYTIFGVILIPWVIVYFDVNNLFKLYGSLNQITWMFLIFGGLIFGFGQVCFFNAINRLGIAKSFAVNISIGLIIGTVFVIFQQNKLWSKTGFLIEFAIILIFFAIIFNYCADKKKTKRNQLSGWFFIFFAGFASGIQNIVFYELSFIIQNLDIHKSFWVWPPFLFFASLPMLVFFYLKNTPQINDVFSVKSIIKNILLISLMGICFSGSLFLYSKAMVILNAPQRSIGWPLFMISIILSSQAWGLIFKENFNSKKIYKIISLFLLTSAILILSIVR